MRIISSEQFFIFFAISESKLFFFIVDITIRRIFATLCVFYLYVS